MQAVDLFSGAGGMSIGASLNGIQMKYSVELDPFAAATYKLNHPKTCVLNKDIKDVKKEDFQKLNKKEPLLLFGGPPCQGFSTSNQRTRNSENANNWLFLEYMRVVKLLQPDVIVLENVKGLKETEKGVFLEKILTSFKCLGFTGHFFLLNAADFGVPQKRERLFIIGTRDNIKLSIPQKKVKVHTTVYDAFIDLPSLTNGAKINVLPYKENKKSKYSKVMRKHLNCCTGHLVTRNSDLIIERYKYIPQGGNWGHIPERLMLNYSDRTRCHTGIYHRLKEDIPSIVVGNFRKNMLIHPWEDRGLSIREAARLQSFPDSFDFVGSIGFQQQQVGNAVPPLLAKAVFEHILESIGYE